MEEKNKITPGGTHNSGNPPAEIPAARARILEALTIIPIKTASPVAHLAGGSVCATSETAEELQAFGRGNKIKRTPPRQTASDHTPKRYREPNSPPSSSQPEKKLKTPLSPIDEMGAILLDLLAKVNEQRVRSINQGMKNSFARLKELQELLKDQTLMAPNQEAGDRCSCNREAGGNKAHVEEATQITPVRATYSKVARTKGPAEKFPPQKGKQAAEIKGAKKSLARKSRPDALIITGNAGSTYGDVLKLITRRQDGKLNDVCQNVKKTRRTAKGDLLLELAAGKDAKVLDLRQTLSQVLGEAASVRAVTEETNIKIRDLDDLTTKDELVAAIVAQMSTQEEAFRVKSLRPGYSGTQVATLGAGPDLASKILSEGRLRIGWTVCRVRERKAQRRCYRCLNFGHIAAFCKEQTDRSNWCLRCGKPGHKVATCTSEAKCFLCAAANKPDQAHVAGTQSLLEQYARDKRVGVALISEPFRKTRSQNYILDSTQSAEIWVFGTQPENTFAGEGFVQAKVNGIWLISCYLPPRLTLQQFGRTLDEVAEAARPITDVIVGGDFNAWAEEWGSALTNARGRTLLETFATLDVALLNTGSRHTFSRAGCGSVIDLTFCSSRLFRRTTWALSDEYTGSDHKYIICDTSNGARETPGSRPIRFNPATLHTQRFAQGIRMEDPIGDAEDGAQHVMLAVEQACRSSMKLSRNHSRHHEPVLWWSPEIAEAKRECLRARRLHQRARGRPDFEPKRQEFADKRRALKTLIKEAKKRCFLEMCDAAEQDPWGTAYRTVVKKAKQAKPLPPREPQTMENILPGDAYPVLAAAHPETFWPNLPDCAPPARLSFPPSGLFLHLPL
ncbi:uncharacterized protein LOC123258324 [Drosophila ananassae]|uniref:uncharacterized protein LOC123258324 n=1 Tax=Drosophila ananassae TaxID=7217 RepID=UPI001CFF565A|nr:uncharacterized protein LOC123258324 [Drosophila ananassae]